MSTAVDNAIKAAKAALKAGDPVAASRASEFIKAQPANGAALNLISSP
jgi:hypothetical protein